MHGNDPLIGKSAKRQELVEEEAFMISRSGEIPEVAFHGSLYHLTEAPDGPHIELDPEDIERLTDAVISCYRRIILRDLTAENRDKRLYRGLARCAVNVRRLLSFAARHGKDVSGLKREFADALVRFLTREWEEVSTGRRTPSINCPYDELLGLSEAIGISHSDFPDGIAPICPPPSGSVS